MLSGVWRLLETTSTLHSTPHDLGHKWSVEVTQIETKNEWSVEVFECFLRFGATVCRTDGHTDVRFEIQFGYNSIIIFGYLLR